jgi:hypothetical protein
MDLQGDGDFFEFNGLVALSKKIVEKNKHTVYVLVYKLVKLALIFSVPTTSVERVFSSMNVKKNRLRNKIGDP